MTTDEKNLIKQFAAGDKSLREKAIEIFRAEIKRTGQARGTPEMNFMAETDNLAPDYALREVYRRKLLKDEIMSEQKQQDPPYFDEKYWQYKLGCQGIKKVEICIAASKKERCLTFKDYIAISRTPE